jgi:uncharacterized MAPEG superfamily protein
MTIEFKFLALSVVLGLLQIIAASHAASFQRGYRWSASSRDEPVAPLIGKAGRLDRALRNFLETFLLFAAAVLAAHLAGRDGIGVYLVRSLVWNVATLGIGLILLSLW